MCVNFVSMDQTYKCPFICTNKQVFRDLEALLFKEINDKYKNPSNYYITNGLNIDKSKTLEENNIRDRSAIIICNDDTSSSNPNQ